MQTHYVQQVHASQPTRRHTTPPHLAVALDEDLCASLAGSQGCTGGGALPRDLPKREVAA